MRQKKERKKRGSNDENLIEPQQKERVLKKKISVLEFCVSSCKATLQTPLCVPKILYDLIGCWFDLLGITSMRLMS